ncbi:MAG: GNAT family acetyltransferase [Methylacidiphilales bacterium]|nr:GNAT family acetyltransferase [Candidatus Methylacidiphilales bacterium]
MEEPNFKIRHYEPRDREAVRRICCETGFLGNPVDPVFEDRELFANFLTAYYTDAEPESSVVLESGGEVRGYIMGCRHPDRQSRYNLRVFAAGLGKLLFRFLFRYQGNTRRYIWWLLTRGRKEVPFTPKGMAHFHINLLPDVRSVPQTRAVIDFFLDYLVRSGEKAVYGQVVTFEKRRGERMFARYGFVVRDSVEVTKYRKYVETPVYLFTVVKDLSAGAKLYDQDLRK